MNDVDLMLRVPGLVLSRAARIFADAGATPEQVDAMFEVIVEHAPAVIARRRTVRARHAEEDREAARLAKQEADAA